MFSMKSYVKITDGEVLKLLLPSDISGQWFISLDNERAIEKIKQYLDPNYLSGAIIMQYDNEVLMDFDLWDEIDMRWPLIMNGVEAFLINKFGDGDILRFEWIAYDAMALLVCCYPSGRIYNVPIKNFLYTLLNAANSFFYKYRKLFSGFERYSGEPITVDYEIERITQLKKIVFDTPQSEWWPCVVRTYFHNPYRKVLGGGADLDEFIYAEDQRGMCSISEALTLDTLLGFLYIEYHGVPILDHKTVFFLDDLFGRLLPVLEQYIIRGISNILQYEGLSLMIGEHSDTHIFVNINQIPMIVPKKRFLRSMLLSTWEIFVQKSDIIFRVMKKRGCREEIGLIQMLLEKVEKLPQ